MLTSWQQALDYFYSRANWETRPPGTLPTFELDRIRRVLAALGQPQTRWPAVHIAGTNGKGSTCVMVASALQEAGYRVGLYTSPHLWTVRERIQVDGRLIEEGAVLAWLNRHRRVLDAEAELTTFEALTALAFSTFAAAGVDVAVVEVGLGGRLDTTNVVHPVVSVLTPIALDHTAVLGDTVEQIAADKCGILRPGVPVVSAPQSPLALEVIRATVQRLGCRLVLVGRDVSWRSLEECRTGQRIQVQIAGPEGTERYRLDLALAGRFQQVNAATALATLLVLRSAGWAIERPAIELGLARARWPARFECWGDGPVLVVDGAHNPHGMANLLTSLEAGFGRVRRHLILGISQGKAVDDILALAVPGAAKVIVTQAPHPRAVPARELARRVEGHGQSALVVPTPARALRLALEMAAPEDLVLATGSIFLAAAVRQAWFDRAGLEPPPRDPPLPADRHPG